MAMTDVIVMSLEIVHGVRQLLESKKVKDGPVVQRNSLLMRNRQMKNMKLWKVMK